MENPTGTKPNTVVEIASNGDLVLILGPEETKLRVCSILLIAASKPFSVMLGPDWKEGHNMHNQQGPFELSLPDDNATALKIVCSIIHHQNETVPRTLAASDILAIAVVADKYLCTNALKFASETWLRTFGSEPHNLMLLTASAYLFRNAQAFSEITRALVLEYDGSYLALRTDEVESIMPWRIFCKYSKTCLPYG
ncbi:hypothetical protein FDENT_9339 [Fusarium denticulatum]|uniref:BTB domain-containing protein n=1 Tax=Fusarium denticulatum TaxID=48507 RepID=A0A8H5TUS9_9HYPO|nr:hypothetical protein FDENT_9339 [Fusarium denticulatum]